MDIPPRFEHAMNVDVEIGQNRNGDLRFDFGALVILQRRELVFVVIVIHVVELISAVDQFMDENIFRLPIDNPIFLDAAALINFFF